MPNSPTDIYRSILGLRTVRHFLDQPVAQGDVHALVEAARWTGSAKNLQRWRFVVVTDTAVKSALADCGDYTDPLRSAPLGFLIVGTPDAYVWDLGRASQNVMLAAATLGLGSCPVTLHRESDARRVIQAPADHVCRYAIAIGRPDQEAEQASRAGRSMGGRKSHEELVGYNRFG